MKITVGLVDDHQLILKSIGLMMATFSHIELVLEAASGADLQQKIAHMQNKPDIVLIDYSMPGMDGVAVAEWMSENYPEIKLVALSMHENEAIIANIINAGCCAFLLKTVSPAEFEKALNDIHQQGYYGGSNLNLVAILKKNAANKFTKQEIRLLELSGTEMKFELIAKELFISPNRVDDIRKTLFEKLDAKNRTDMVIKALKKGIIKLENIKVS